MYEQWYVSYLPQKYYYIVVYNLKIITKGGPKIDYEVGVVK